MPFYLHEALIKNSRKVIRVFTKHFETENLNAMSTVLDQTEAVHAELERILKSAEFSSSPRLVRFLRYCVQQTCDGRLENLKESVIGVNVFDRDPSYDPKVDPIVRVNARRLREKLQAFYASEGHLAVIIGIPKGGYGARFEETARPSNVQSPPPVESVPVVSRPKISPWLISILAVVLGLVWIVLSGRATRGDFAEPALQPLISLPGSANDPAWAPDGMSVAFTWDGGSEPSNVYLLKRGETVPSKLSESKQPEFRPVWSADGTRILLLREAPDNHFEIVMVDLTGKAERVVRTVVYSPLLPVPPALDWSANGEWIVTSETPSDDTNPAHLVLVSPADGRSWVITDPPNASTGDLEARFTPDGKRILFRRGGHGDLFMLSLNGTTTSLPTEVTHANAGVDGFSMSRDGKSIFLASQQGYDRFGIWRIRDGASSPTRITPASMAAISPAVDPMGRFLTFVQPMVDLNLWLYDVHQSGEPRLLVPSTESEYSPAFSPDGRKIAFVSDRSGAANIWIAAMNSGQPRKLTSLKQGEIVMYPAWSPDGTRIVFYSRRNGVNYANEVEVATGSIRPLRGGDDYSLFPQYSGDGRSLYFLSNMGNRFRIWRQQLERNAGAEPVVADEARSFRTSKDGRYLYFLQFNPMQLFQLNLVTKEKRNLWSFADSIETLDAWDVAGSNLFYLSRESAHSSPQIVAVDLHSRERRVIGEFRRPNRHWQTGIAASPDGQSVVVTRVDKDDTRLMLLQLDH